MQERDYDQNVQMCFKSMLDDICLASGPLLQRWRGWESNRADWSQQEDKYLLAVDKLPVCLDGLVRNALTVLQTLGIIQEPDQGFICMRRL